MMEKQNAEEIYIEGVGEVRRLTERQYYKAFGRRDRNSYKRALAFACGRTLAEFNRLSPELQKAVHRAYVFLTDDRAAIERLAPEPQPTPFQKGIHRTDAEKVEIGRALLDIKERLPRGHFGPRLDAMGVPRGFAPECMRTARKEGGAL